MEQIKTRIETGMQEKKLSLLALSEQTGIARMTLKRHLDNPDQFKVDELLRIATALDTTVAQLTADAA